MSVRVRLLALLTGSLALALALPAAAQQPEGAGCPASNATIGGGKMAGFGEGMPAPPCQDPSLPPATPRLDVSKSSEFPPPAGDPARPEFRVASTELGFDKGIGPAPGYSIAYQGKRYLVIDIKTADGSPFFSGGTRFVIGVDGASLDVGLAAMPADAVAKSGPAQAANVLN